MSAGRSLGNTWAFPVHGAMGEVVQEGMDLRTYIATAAMQAIAPIYAQANNVNLPNGVGADHFHRNVPAHAVRLADALLEELAR